MPSSPTPSDQPSSLAVIAGSGIGAEALAEALAGALDTTVEHRVQSATGANGSAQERTLLQAGPVFVLARHGHGNPTPAHLVDHHANLGVLSAIGCTRVVALASVGSLHADLAVGTVVAPHDFFALHHAPTVHDTTDGHRVPGFNLPWRRQVVAAWSHDATHRPLLDGAVYAQTTGPRFETPAEVRFLATVADIVGMTIATECVLAGELGLAYAALCQVDNLGNGLAAHRLEPEDLARSAAATADRFRSEVVDVVCGLLANSQSSPTSEKRS